MEMPTKTCPRHPLADRIFSMANTTQFQHFSTCDSVLPDRIIPVVPNSSSHEYRNVKYVFPSCSTTLDCSLQPFFPRKRVLTNVGYLSGINIKVISVKKKVCQKLLLVYFQGPEFTSGYLDWRYTTRLYNHIMIC